MKDRFEVHAHTHYSNLRLLDCINRPKDLIKRAIELGLAGIAITDHEALCGHIEINILDFLKETSDFAKRVKKWIGFKEEPMIVFIVHESPSNKCSEREVLLKYFADNHIDCRELEYPINNRD